MTSVENSLSYQQYATNIPLGPPDAPRTRLRSGLVPEYARKKLKPFTEKSQTPSSEGDWSRYKNVLVARAKSTEERIHELYLEKPESLVKAIEFVRQPDTMRQVDEIITRARAIVLPVYERFQQARATKDARLIDSTYQHLCQAFADLYMLCSPIPNPDEHDYVVRAEKRHNLKSIVRQPDGKQLLWSPSEPTRVSVPGEKFQEWLKENPDKSISDFPDTTQAAPDSVYRSRMRLRITDPEKELTAAEKDDLATIHGPNGVIIHTVAAAELFLRLTRRIQSEAWDTIGPSVLQQRFASKDFDPYEGAISLWVHDIGRLITHDPTLHIVFSEMISREMGLKEKDRQDYDLSSELKFHTDHPLIDPTSKEQVIEFIKDPVKMMWYLCDFFSKFKKRDELEQSDFERLRNNTHTYADYIRMTRRIRFHGDEQDFIKDPSGLLPSQLLKQRLYVHEAALVDTLFRILYDTEIGLHVAKEEAHRIFTSVESVKIAFLRRTQDYLIKKAHWNPNITW